jgi:hypothetical protein
MKTINHPIGVGDRIRLTEDVTVNIVTYHKGHEFTIVDSGPRGFDVRDDDGDTIQECLSIHKYFEKVQ